MLALWMSACVSFTPEYCVTISKVLFNCIWVLTVFDDGDITTLRRTALCLKSGRHFNESETLDQLPLTHPEHFSTPVVVGRRGRRSRQLKWVSNTFIHYIHKLVVRKLTYQKKFILIWMLFYLTNISIRTKCIQNFCWSFLRKSFCPAKRFGQFICWRATAQMFSSCLNTRASFFLRQLHSTVSVVVPVKKAELLS